MSVVHSVIYDPSSGKASGVRVIDAETYETIEYTARIVFLCASALESTRILLNSKTERWPDGLANSSGQLGKNLMDHTMGGGARGVMPGNENLGEYGSPAARHLSAALRESYGRGSTSRLPARVCPTRAARHAPSGREDTRWRDSARNSSTHSALPAHGVSIWEASASACRASRTMSISTQRWWISGGFRRLRIHCQWSDNERKMLQEMAVQAGRDAGVDRSARRIVTCRRQSAGAHDPRNGHGTDGARPGDFRPQWLEPGVGCPEPLHDGRRLYDLPARIRTRASPTWRSRRGPRAMLSI